MTQSLHPAARQALTVIARKGPMTALEFSETPGMPEFVRGARGVLKGLTDKGYVFCTKLVGEPATYTATMRGRALVKPATPVAPPGGMALPRGYSAHGTYAGRELRPFDGRPGAMDFKALPTRGFPT